MPRRRCPLPCPVAFATLSFGLADPPASDPSGYPPCLPRRYSAVRAASGMGRMDCACRHHHPCLMWRRHLRHEKDAGEPEGQEEADCRECGNERGELLQPPERCDDERRILRPESAGGNRDERVFRLWLSGFRHGPHFCYIPHRYARERR